jgi:hypothetical protein
MKVKQDYSYKALSWETKKKDIRIIPRDPETGMVGVLYIPIYK